MLDAQRRELFVGRFRMDSTAATADDLPKLARVEADRIVIAEQWLASLVPGTVVTGAGVTRLEQQLPPGVIAVPVEFRQARASVVGRLAWRDYEHGRRDDLWMLAPIYLRPSYAEEKVAGTKFGAGGS